MKPQSDLAYAKHKKQQQQQMQHALKQEQSYSCKENHTETENENENCDIKQPVFEKKRTANLENLIGNIKVRKLNQAEPQSQRHQMTSLYVDTVHGERSSLGDCSPQSPLLSSVSPSVSPSSESINAHSPAHTSPASSSSSLNGLNNKSRYSIANPKFRWMMESATANSMDTTQAALFQHQLQLESLKKLDPAKIKELMNSMAWYTNSNSSNASSQDFEANNNTNNNSNNSNNQSNNQPTLESVHSTSAKKSTARFNGKKCNYNNSHKAVDNKADNNNNNSNINADQSLNTSNSDSMENIANLKYSICPTSKNQEDPTRQIKFYDDFIDFRGDILRRPPDSKNCRILWEYLYLLLQNPSYSSVIRWEDESQMVFRIVQAEKLAALWGLQKNRLGMTYEKLSRGMRYYYPNNIIAREAGRRLLYRFMRHPNEIKKFVKKNGTYMLKRAKLGDKNNTSMDSSMPSGDIDVDTESIADINPEDSSIDESFYDDKSVKRESTTQLSNNNHSNSKFTMNNNNNNKGAEEAYEDFEEPAEFDEDTPVSVEDSDYPESQQAATTRALVNAMTGASANRNMFNPASMYSQRDMFQYYLAAASAGLMNNGSSAGSSMDPTGNQFLQETIKNLSLNLNSTSNKNKNSTSSSSKSVATKSQQNPSANSFNYNAFQQQHQHQNETSVSQQQQNLANFLKLASNLDIQRPLNLSLGSSGSSNSTTNGTNKNRKNKYDIKVNDN